MTAYEKLDDATIVARCLKHDEDAWRELVTRYSRLVYTIARRGGLREEECHDVFQQVFAALVPGIRRLRDPSCLAKWLITATRRWTARVRSDRARDPAGGDNPDRADDFVPADLLDRLEVQHGVRQGLRELGGRCEALLEMLYLRGDHPEYTAVSHSLGIPVGSIGPTRARCLAKLRTLLIARGLDLAASGEAE